MKSFCSVLIGFPLLTAVLALLLAHPASGQTMIKLWNGLAPGAVAATGTADTLNNNPYMFVYPASVSNANGAAAVICPGGGYTGLATLKEGTDIAKWLNTLGVSCFVLRYRLGATTGKGPFRHPIEMWDAQRAIRWVRANAALYGIDINRVGIVGFSAGGHLASTAATHFDAGNPTGTSIDNYTGTHDSVDNFSCRPDFHILGYPVITMDASFTHGGSRSALLGATPTQALVDLLSNEKQVTANTPPAFLVHTTNDGTVPVKNSQVYSDSLQKKGITRSKLLIYPTGTHGFGLADGKDGAPLYADVGKWPDSAAAWLRSLGFLTATTGILRHNSQDSRNPIQGIFIASKTERFGSAWNILGREMPSRNKAPFAPIVSSVSRR
jgi:acetyl esterase/lipase